MIRESITIINKLGLHARAAAKLVSCAEQFESSIQLGRDGREVDGKSIMSVMMLAASCGTDIDLIIEGADETDARDALVELINNRFDEDE
ncbi:MULTISPECIES: HPr family phosphocarrier protein [Gammaproteobacteria]|uniref:HPr family phosphocarrier protein n=1 Tax=Vreelandella halophila TaxID=86177 RepID=A0A9X5B4D1_9GAMM|nr:MULTISPECIES: HPr family phosphocarrier protein [Gammaproteobacteria]KAA8979772.1 HPr family phosphocarrier protein [Halospina sp. K52047b]MYL25499.1 HPr family phosphocarrier protein [Halomonas utahensis]MYL74735.1 HPr family phosphocarrier protein [Halomonas sp. 22501_18_FS]